VTGLSDHWKASLFKKDLDLPTMGTLKFMEIPFVKREVSSHGGHEN